MKQSNNSRKKFRRNSQFRLVENNRPLKEFNINKRRVQCIIKKKQPFRKWYGKSWRIK